MSDIDRAGSALHALDPGCGRQDWAVIGMSAKDAGVPLDDFIAWSRSADNFDSERDCKAAWRSFKPGEVTEATLFRLALDAGWRDPARADKPLNGHNGITGKSGRLNGPRLNARP